MIAPTIPTNELERLQELYRLDILDTANEEEYDEIVHLATSICKVPISLISLVDANRQWFKARIGIEVSETTREVSFCAHMLSEDIDSLQVLDAEKDERFFDNPLVTSDPPSIRFYAGVPLVTSNGYKLGSLCVIDRKPNELSKDQTYALKVLSNQIIRMLELRVLNKEMAKQKLLMEQQNAIQKKMLSIIAHDVRSPLGSLKQVLEMEDMNALTDEERVFIYNELKTQVGSTLNLLNNLVDWGNEQILGGEILFQKIHLHTLVDQKISTLKLAATLKNIDLNNLVDAAIYLQTNENMLSFVIRNFVANAIKFTQAGSVTIYAELQADKVHIAVNDSGVGMSAESIDNLLNKKIAKTTVGTNKEKGSGLGLLLAQDFITALNGTLQIESELGKGTTMHLFLPSK